MSWSILIRNILKIGSDLVNILLAVAMEMFPNKNIQVCQTNVVISSLTYCFPSTLQFYDTNVMSLNLATKLAPKYWTLRKMLFIITHIPLPRLTLKSMKVSKFMINFLLFFSDFSRMEWSMWKLLIFSIYFVLIRYLLFILLFILKQRKVFIFSVFLTSVCFRSMVSQCLWDDMLCSVQCYWCPFIHPLFSMLWILI
jgi:hypothetical protein